MLGDLSRLKFNCSLTETWHEPGFEGNFPKKSVFRAFGGVLLESFGSDLGGCGTRFDCQLLKP